MAAQALLCGWRAAVHHLSSYIGPGRLELSLVCDIDPQYKGAIDLANSVLEPLRLLPPLRSCHIRLCKTRDPRLLRLAEDTALQDCGIARPYRKPTSKRAVLITLPRELRLRILEFTDLVTPSKEVWWSRQHYKYAWADIGALGYCLDDMRSCHFLECWYRQSTHARLRAGLSIGCFCRRRHAAFSSTCTCWVPPGPDLFLVCHTLCQDAQLVFFSSNHFIVFDLNVFPSWDLRDRIEDKNAEILTNHYPYGRLAASHFLRDVIPARCIAHLRFLELLFPPYLPPTWPQPDHPAMQDWLETVGWLRDMINGPGLTLRLVGSEVGIMRPEEPYTDTITVAEGDRIHRAYLGLSQSMTLLTEGPNALARFYADLPYSWQ